MKRIVTFVAPLAPVDSPQDDKHGSGAGGAGAGDLMCDEAVSPSPASPGVMRLEVVVSDRQANRIIDALLKHGSGDGSSPAESTDRDLEEDPIGCLVQQALDGADPGASGLLDRIVRQVERQLISKVYSDCDYVKSRAAMRLGINRNTLLKKLREFGEVGGDPD